MNGCGWYTEALCSLGGGGGSFQRNCGVPCALPRCLWQHLWLLSTLHCCPSGVKGLLLNCIDISDFLSPVAKAQRNWKFCCFLYNSFMSLTQGSGLLI